MNNYYGYLNELQGLEESRSAFEERYNEININKTLIDQQRNQFLEGVLFPTGQQLLKGFAKSERGQEIIKGGLRKIGIKDTDELASDLAEGDFEKAFTNQVSRIIDRGTKQAREAVDNLTDNLNDRLVNTIENPFSNLSRTDLGDIELTDPSTWSSTMRSSNVPISQENITTTLTANEEPISTSLSAGDTYRDIVNDSDKFNEYFRSNLPDLEIDDNEIEGLRNDVINNPSILPTAQEAGYDTVPENLDQILSRTRSLLSRPAEETGAIRGDSTLARALNTSRTTDTQPSETQRPQLTQEGIEEQPLETQTPQQVGEPTAEVGEEIGEGVAEATTAETTGELAAESLAIPGLGEIAAPILGLVALGTGIASIFDFGKKHKNPMYQQSNPSEQFGI